MKLRSLVVLAIAVTSWPSPCNAVVWERCGVGSWVTIEIRQQGTSGPRHHRTTIVVKKNDEYGPWVAQTYPHGETFEYGPVSDEAFEAMIERRVLRDSMVGRTVLSVDGRPVNCRVFLKEKTGGPPCGNSPIAHVDTREWRWETEDPQGPLVLKRCSGAGRIYYRDGRVVAMNDSTTWSVVRTGETIVVRGDALRCVVATTEPYVYGGAVTGKLTSWLCDRIPDGWAKEIVVGTDLKTGRPAVVERLVVGFRVK